MLIESNRIGILSTGQLYIDGTGKSSYICSIVKSCSKIIMSCVWRLLKDSEKNSSILDASAMAFICSTENPVMNRDQKGVNIGFLQIKMHFWPGRSTAYSADQSWSHSLW